MFMSNLNDFAQKKIELVQDSLPLHPEFLSSRKLADEAFNLADTHLTPLFPRTYEVWYTYASGTNELINQRVDSIIKDAGNLNTFEIDQIHGEALSATENQQDAVSETLKQELDAIVKLIQSHLNANENYTGSLDETMDSLTDAATPAEIREVINLLISENQKMQRETSKLTDKLGKSQEQVQAMRKELVEARENEMRDLVTGLGNRRWFEWHLSTLMNEARTSGASLCLALIDIDHFKRINDTFGHLAGDQVLKFFGQIMQKNIKGKDICARYGGEEFAIILPNTHLKDALMLIDSIRQKFENANLVFAKSKKPVGVITASFGLVKMNPNDDCEGIVQRADMKLYEAKNSGRNCIMSD